MKLFNRLKQAGLLAASAAVLFTACKKDDNNGNNPGPTPPGAAKLKKVSMDNQELEFGYGTDGSVKTVKMTDDFITSGTATTFNVTYNAEKKVSELKASDGFRIAAQYTGGELTTANMYDETNTLIFTTRYEYLNGTLKSVVSSIAGMEALKFSFTYDAAGNVQKMNTWGYDPITGQLAANGYSTFTYDGKTNPMHAHKELLYLLLQNTSKNNTTKSVDYDQQNQITETKEFTYQYNNQNLPQSATVKTTASGQVSNTTVLFSYQ